MVHRNPYIGIAPQTHKYEYIQSSYSMTSAHHQLQMTMYVTFNPITTASNLTPVK